MLCFLCRAETRDAPTIGMGIGNKNAKTKQLQKNDKMKKHIKRQRLLVAKGVLRSDSGLLTSINSSLTSGNLFQNDYRLVVRLVTMLSIMLAVVGRFAVATVFAPTESFAMGRSESASPGQLAATKSPDKVSTGEIYHKGWIDLNKNGKMDPYEDRSLSIEQRIDDLLSRMTVEEKTCQLVTLYGYKRVLKDPFPTPGWKKRVWKDGLANIDEQFNGIGGSARGFADTPAQQAKSLNRVQRFFVEQTRLGIPVDFTNEGIRGICMNHGTNFPPQIGVASSWDKELVSQIGHVTGIEAKVSGYTNVYAPILDLARDPRWGRVVETYGEDPYLVTALGLEMVKALRAEGVGSSPKHFAVYSVPKGGRDGMARTDPHVCQREMRFMYLMPFRAAIMQGHATGVMASYNDYNGVPIAGSKYFLTDILRKRWGFKGYVVSDSNAVVYLYSKHHVADSYKEAVRQSINAGLNVRTRFNAPEVFVKPLRELVHEGKITMQTLNSRVRDVLRVKFMLGIFDHPYITDFARANKVVHCAEHLKIAARAARESIILLKNQSDVLPLNLHKIKTILITGPNAKTTAPMISRYGPRTTVTSVYEGIKAALPDKVKLLYEKGCDVIDPHWPESEIMPFEMSDKDRQRIARAARAAKQADVAIVVVGDSVDTVGESRSRTSLQLPGYQKQLVQAIYKTGTPVIVVLINGRAMAINWIAKYVPGIIEAWFPGSYCGHAVAEVLFGKYNPSGKLPVTFPRCVGQIPLNFPCKPGSQAGQPGRHSNNPNGCGASRVVSPLYPFGYGLSYTTFKYSRLTVSPRTIKPGDTVTVAFDLTNSGKVAGTEIAQLYLRDDYSSVTTYEKNLRGFARVSLQPGQTKHVTFTLSKKDMQLINTQNKWVVEPGSFTVWIGSSSVNMQLQGSFTVKD